MTQAWCVSIPRRVNQSVSIKLSSTLAIDQNIYTITPCYITILSSRIAEGASVIDLKKLLTLDYIRGSFDTISVGWPEDNQYILPDPHQIQISVY